MDDRNRWAEESRFWYDMGITDQDIDERKAFLEFRDEDASALRNLADVAREYADPVIDEFYRHLLSFGDTRAFFDDPGTLERVKRLQRAYFLGLTDGNYDAEYVANRLKIGVVHERVELPMKWYLGAYNFYLRAVARRLFQAHSKEAAKTLSTFLSLTKLVFLDIGLATDTYIYQREATIRKQQDAIHELSTPVLQIRERLLLVPIIGLIDTERARMLTEALLHAIRANRARVVVMDVTGVATIDSKVANHLVQTVDAARLMGATVIVTGLAAEVAQSLVGLGIDLSKLNTVGDLQGGIDEADRLLGYEVVSRAPRSDRMQSV